MNRAFVRLRRVFPAIPVALIPFLALGCGTSGQVAHQNEPPTVELTTAPLQGQVVSYSIDIGWEGTDPDGVIDRYEYAVDPPAAFTEEEIASGGDGVSSEVIPGGGSGPDVTRITKIVDGSPVSFDWVHTTDTSHHFIFQTANAESVYSGGAPVPSGRFTGMHAVYVRAVDNDNAVSVPAHVAFTAETVAPEATIVRPRIDSPLTTGADVTLAWDGTDPDGPPPPSYLYKLVRLDTLEPMIPLLAATPKVLFDKGDGWNRWNAGDPDLQLHLATPGTYIFGVRAVDEAGAVEPFLDFGRNTFKFQAFAGSGYPTLTLSSLAGTFTFLSTTPPAQADIPANLGLPVDVTCSAEEYGESCQAFRWGLDIVDLEDDTQWTPWSTDFAVPPLDLSAGIHVLYAQVRDTLGHITQGSVVLTAVEFTRDREALWVDDSFDDLYPRDADHDAFWQARFDAYPGFVAGDVTDYSVFGDNDRATFYPQALTLSDLSRYKLVVWENRGSGFDANTGLVQSIIHRSLQLYLAAGGELWLDGRMNIGATVPDVTGLRGDLNYPKELAPGDFAWDFLKLHTTKINNDKGAVQRNNLLVVHPFPGNAEIYPEMTVDSAKQSPALAGLGIPFVDAVFDPILVDSEPGFAGTLDSLYAYGATGNEIQGNSSVYQNRLVAVRWHDQDPGRKQGRIQWFGFPLYYFNDAEAQETLNRSLDWFREETPPAP